MAILRFNSIFLQSIDKVFLEYDGGGVDVLHEDHPEPLTEAVVILVRPEVPAGLPSGLVSHVQTRPRDMAAHEVPDV